MGIMCFGFLGVIVLYIVVAIRSKGHSLRPQPTDWGSHKSRFIQYTKVVPDMFHIILIS